MPDKPKPKILDPDMVNMTSARLVRSLSPKMRRNLQVVAKDCIADYLVPDTEHRTFALGMMAAVANIRALPDIGEDAVSILAAIILDADNQKRGAATAAQG